MISTLSSSRGDAMQLPMLAARSNRQNTIHRLARCRAQQKSTTTSRPAGRTTTQKVYLERAGLAYDSQSSATASAARMGCSAFRLCVLQRIGETKRSDVAALQRGHGAPEATGTRQREELQPRDRPGADPGWQYLITIS